ncbi:uncharacterized protein LOC124694477 [Lolium rigidum]|uniref:uncharacterized protein LOC124694477 n=2 Tax=Lolium TaxID=4520 RepID=UPI001F5DD0F7|nr:uncharacterized protein LOC124694477 [Lolium rigidum]XP_051230986.1 uncharacterized protein LOC127349268 [Lolium perenne]
MAPIKINLAVDMSWNRVLFADAGSDFVDVLLAFLTIPLSAVQLLPADASSRGCLCNLGDSVDSLSDIRLLKVEACCGTLLTPAHSDEFPLCNCKSTLIPRSSFFPMSCKCSLVFDRLLHVYEQVGRKETFVGEKQRYVISDDCTIKPASTSSMQSMPQAFNSDGTGHTFEVVEQLVEWEQVVAMLNASLSSDTMLTDAFLPKESNYNAAHATVKPGISLKNFVSDRDSAGSLPESKLKIFYDTREKKVMYAECSHDFVDLLLGFTIHPLSSVIKNTGAGTCHLGRCLDNLYRSVSDLDDAGCLTGGFPKMKLLDASVMPFDVSSKAMCKALDCRCRKDMVPDLARYCCHPDLVEYGRYVVGDNLFIHQASAITVMKHWFGRNKAMVLEMDIAIGKQEAVALLRAMLTSKTVLTDVFIHRLEKHSSLQKMQIFARIPTCKTITVEITRSDTIASVKSKIKEKVTIPAGCRHELVYGSRYLKDSCTVAECGLVRECTIGCEFYKSA